MSSLPPQRPTARGSSHTCTDTPLWGTDRNQITNWCQTTEVLYLITCDKPDKKQYLGQTKLSGHSRGLAHLSTVRNNNATNAPVGLHFRSEGHSHADMVMTPFEKIFNRDPHVRLARERDYINKYGLIQHGLNKNMWRMRHYILCLFHSL